MDGSPIVCDGKIAEGGEGVVYRSNSPGLVIKIFHEPSTLRRKKIEAMIENPAHDHSLTHNSFTWPLAIIIDENGAFRGYAMADISDTLSLNAVYNAKLRQRQRNINWYGLHAIAANVAHLFHNLHCQDIVIGDIKSDNFRVDGFGAVSLIDTDSLALSLNGKRYACPVGSEGFTPPELINRNLATVSRDETQDRYGLAILLFQLLTGQHPFHGSWRGFGEPPTIDRLIQLGLWPHGPTRKIEPGQLALPLETLHEGLRDCFERCFLTGHKAPDERPSAWEWYQALCGAMAELVSCTEEHGHFHLDTQDCPWCARKESLGLDVFPQNSAAADPVYPLILTFERALARGDGEMALELWDTNAMLRHHAQTKGRKVLLNRLRQDTATMQLAAE
jgi:DNA-binding helix-hairpin-helix protein with protein kinase domain